MDEFLSEVCVPGSPDVLLTGGQTPSIPLKITGTRKMVLLAWLARITSRRRDVMHLSRVTREMFLTL